jgi:hypothetical protein
VGVGVGVGVGLDVEPAGVTAPLELTLKLNVLLAEAMKLPPGVTRTRSLPLTTEAVTAYPLLEGATSTSTCVALFCDTV